MYYDLIRACYSNAVTVKFHLGNCSFGQDFDAHHNENSLSEKNFKRQQNIELYIETGVQATKLFTKFLALQNIRIISLKDFNHLIFCQTFIDEKKGTIIN